MLGRLVRDGLESDAAGGSGGCGQRAGARSEKLFCISDPAGAIEMISLRARAVGSFDWPWRAKSAGGRRLAPSVGRRTILFQGERQSAALYDRGGLIPGQRITGPSVIQQPDTTVLIPPGWTAYPARGRRPGPRGGHRAP